MPAPARDPRGWPLERVLLALAGSVSVLGALLTALLSPWFVLLVAFVGLNQLLFVAVGACPASFVLTRVLRLRPASSCPVGPTTPTPAP